MRYRAGADQRSLHQVEGHDGLREQAPHELGLPLVRRKRGEVDRRAWPNLRCDHLDHAVGLGAERGPRRLVALVEGAGGCAPACPRRAAHARRKAEGRLNTARPGLSCSRLQVRSCMKETGAGAPAGSTGMETALRSPASSGANLATVDASNIFRIGRAMPCSRPRRPMICAARREWPPRAKKSSWMLMRAMPRASCQSWARSRSASSRGAAYSSSAPGTEVGRRQGLAVDLPVGREREVLERHEVLRDHVLGQRCACRCARSLVAEGHARARHA